LPCGLWQVDGSRPLVFRVEHLSGAARLGVWSPLGGPVALDLALAPADPAGKAEGYRAQVSGPEGQTRELRGTWGAAGRVVFTLPPGVSRIQVRGPAPPFRIDLARLTLLGPGAP
jgi:hypothetical protein